MLTVLKTATGTSADSHRGGNRGVYCLAVLLCMGCHAALAEDESALAGQPAAEVAPAAGEQVPGSGEQEEDSYEPLILVDEAGNPIDPCRQFDEEAMSWLDAGRTGFYRTVCSTAARFDSFFGGARYDDRSGNTFGRLSVGGYWDERDKFDADLRLRANFALPALRENAKFFIGRGDEAEFLEELNGSGAIRPPVVGAADDDTALFAGFGFSRSRSLEQGFSLRVGARFRTPVEPFVKARYNYAWRLTDSNLIRARPVVYWIDREGFGSTLTVDFDNYLGDSYLLRLSNFGNVTEDPEIEGVRWGSTLSLFQALSRKRAVTYSVFVRGETRDPVQLKNAGLQFSFRHRFLREWLFLEYTTSLSWPREFTEEEREANFGLGAGFEIYFGPNPGPMR